MIDLLRNQCDVCPTKLSAIELKILYAKFQVSCCCTYTAIPKKDFLKIPYFFVFRFFEVTWHVVFDPEAGVDRTEVTTTPLRRDPTYIR